MTGDAPFLSRFRVEALGDGHCRFTGGVFGGCTAVLGPVAVLRVLDRPGDPRVVVGSRRSQCLDLAVFTHVGVAPRAACIRQ